MKASIEPLQGLIWRVGFLQLGICKGIGSGFIRPGWCARILML